MEYHVQECSQEVSDTKDFEDIDSGDISQSQLLVKRNGNNTLDDKAGFWKKLKKSLPFAKDETSVREAIEELIEEEDGQSDKSVEIHERALIANVLNLRDLPVIDVMIPRVDILALDVCASRADMAEIMVDKPHSRLPVYHDTLDNVVGSVHLKDVIGAFVEDDKDGKIFDLKDYLRNVLVVSPSMRVLDLLLQMRQSKVHIAIVIDEYGGTDGLITISDLVEAIVGEIDDEHGLEVNPELVERRDGTILADARYSIEDFEEKFGDFLAEEEREDVDTLGGLVNLIAGHVPTRGEVIVHNAGIEFEVVDADPRRVHRLCIRNVYKTI